MADYPPGDDVIKPRWSPGGPCITAHRAAPQMWKPDVWLTCRCRYCDRLIQRRGLFRRWRHVQ